MVSCACIIRTHPKSLISYVDRCVFILSVHAGVQACVYANCAWMWCLCVACGCGCVCVCVHVVTCVYIWCLHLWYVYMWLLAWASVYVLVCIRVCISSSLFLLYWQVFHTLCSVNYIRNMCMSVVVVYIQFSCFYRHRRLVLRNNRSVKSLYGKCASYQRVTGIRNRSLTSSRYQYYSPGDNTNM